MVTLEAGRVKPDDVTTIKLVLKALSHQVGPNQYSILINKMSKEVETLLLNSEEDREELASCLIPPSFKTMTNSIYYVPLYQEWVDKTDSWGLLSPEVLSFISNAPEVDVSYGLVKPILVIQFEDLLKALLVEIRKLTIDKSKMQKAIKKRTKAVGKLQWTLAGASLPFRQRTASVSYPASPPLRTSSLENSIHTYPEHF